MSVGVGGRFILTIYHILESTRESARRRPAAEQGWFKPMLITWEKGNWPNVWKLQKKMIFQKFL